MVPGWVAERVRAHEWTPVCAGYTRAPKWRARLSDGTSVFVKFAERDDLALRPLSTELIVYRHLREPYLPTVFDLYEDDVSALLVLEDLSSARWPPPYPDDVGPLFDALDAVAATQPPPLPRLEEPSVRAWERFERDAKPLLALSVCSERWLADALPVLAAAAAGIPVAGDALVHYDVWAENLCFAPRGAVLVDWAEAKIGNAAIDLAFALLSLRVAGVTPPPVENEPALAAFVTGVIAVEASTPPPSWAHEGSTLRQDQLADLEVALPWTAGLLGLPVPA